MGAIDTYSFTIIETPHILPNNFLVTERWPSMCSTFIDELLHCTTTWSNKQRFTSDTVIVCYFALVQNFLFPVLSLKIASVLCIMSVKAANSVSSSNITAISKILLNWFLASTVSFLRHNRFLTLNWILSLLHLILLKYTIKR